MTAATTYCEPPQDGSDGCWGGPGNDVCKMGPGMDGCHGEGLGNDRPTAVANPDQPTAAAGLRLLRRWSGSGPLP